MKFSLPKTDIEKSSQAPSFKMPETYQYYSALMGLGGKFAGFAGGPFGSIYSSQMSAMQTPYGRISLKGK
jgi:hypothetical protein